MKYITLITITFCILNACQAQINLEKTFADGEFVVSASGYFGTNYYPEYLLTYDKTNQSLNFYNDDLSIYKTLTNIFDENHVSIVPSYLTRKLFNTDDKLEFLASISNKDGTFTIKIINEDGDVIEDFGKGSYAYCIKINNKIKLLVNTVEVSYDPANPGAKHTSKLYSIPGRLD